MMLVEHSLLGAGGLDWEKTGTTKPRALSVAVVGTSYSLSCRHSLEVGRCYPASFFMCADES